ncbi:hypothetical protein [Mycobacterium spongiae]|uniref:GH18 domain-containing protein n=1 Tax=Mycobacterium spongiae TaxID=886343 RepID=A0A975JW29_9MYCO|nr:hypothetical protein [Mycobacterium spongiae]QUR66736.1 hypothetical protein F6B93_06175 [Mycobacterium spongiae]
MPVGEFSPYIDVTLWPPPNYADLAAAGIDDGTLAFIVSGAGGEPAADATVLAAQLRLIVDTFGIHKFDFDVEGGMQANKPVLTRQAQAIAAWSVDDAQQLVTFAQEKGVGELSMWSVARDATGQLGSVTPHGSGIANPAAMARPVTTTRQARSRPAARPCRRCRQHRSRPHYRRCRRCRRCR